MNIDEVRGRAQAAIEKLLRFGRSQREIAELVDIPPSILARLYHGDMYGDSFFNVRVQRRLEAAAEVARKEMLALASELRPSPIQLYSCFISYSTLDEPFAAQLFDDLETNGVRCWFAPHSIQAGKKLHLQIDEAIRVYDRLLLILSEASMNSEWVKTEIAYARQKELNEHRQVLFPIGLASFSKIRDWACFDADTGKDSAREIREYFVPDFSNWKSRDAYQRMFRRLLLDFKRA